MDADVLRGEATMGWLVCWNLVSEEVAANY